MSLSSNDHQIKPPDQSPEKAALARMEEVLQTGATKLDLNGLELTELSPDISQLNDLSVLVLSNNRLSTLPAEISKLTKLTFLDLADNRFSSLPSVIIELTNILSLDLSGNKLKELPDQITLLRRLAWLDISRNHLSALPRQIGELTNLYSLNLSKNNFSTLPIQITRLTNLSWLDLSNNQLVTLPKEIDQLSKLSWLDLSNNNLPTLPPELLRLSELIRLDLQTNQLSIPPEILEETRKPRTILSYYFQHLKRPLNEAKLLVVGQGSVGKTSLVHRLMHNTYDEHENKTDGISIAAWTMDSRQGAEDPLSKTKLNIWDFGGQEIMHTTHQFFLTKRSIYLLVLDARLTQEENRVEYWLKIIQSFGAESPVILVGNKTDQHPLDIDRTGLRNKYPNIVEILETSAATGAGIPELQHALAHQLDILPHVHDLLPESWFAVKAHLESLGRDKNYLTRDEYLALCIESGITDELSQRTLISFLHDLGIVLHFQDVPRLEVLGILNPLWVTNGVYKILNAHILFHNKGVLTLSMLDDILNLPEYPRDKRLFIIDIMRKFELCYDMEPEQSFLVPDLLPKDEPYTGDWSDALAFQFRYKVLPSSMISRFIVRMNAFVHRTLWRSGVVLKRDDNTALVKADYEDEMISILVSGNKDTRREFLIIIRGEFEALHRTIAKIEVSSKVPHPKYPGLVLDYDELMEFERQGITEFPRKIDDKLVMCNVKKLLAGVEKSVKLKVFVSYAKKDIRFARRLVERLESSGFDPWWDKSGIEAGETWSKEIQVGMDTSQFVLVVLSPNMEESKWVTKEINYAESKNKKIIPILCKPCDIPISLIDKQYIDFSGKNFEKSFQGLKAYMEKD